MTIQHPPAQQGMTIQHPASVIRDVDLCFYIFRATCMTFACANGAILIASTESGRLYGGGEETKEQAEKRRGFLVFIGMKISN